MVVFSLEEEIHMDADRNIIPVVEGDQGEGFMDPIDSDVELSKRERQLKNEQKVEILTQERRNRRKLRKMGLR